MSNKKIPSQATSLKPSTAKTNAETAKKLGELFKKALIAGVKEDKEKLAAKRVNLGLSENKVDKGEVHGNEAKDCNRILQDKLRVCNTSELNGMPHIFNVKHGFAISNRASHITATLNRSGNKSTGKGMSFRQVRESKLLDTDPQTTHWILKTSRIPKAEKSRTT